MKNGCDEVIKNIPPAPTIYKVVFGGGLPEDRTNFQKLNFVLETL